MAATPPRDLCSAPVRVPKLKYRQSTYSVTAPDTASISSSAPSVPTISLTDGQSEPCTSPRFPPSISSKDSSSRRTSLAPSSPGLPRTPEKSKKGFFSSLFATKEPSALALAAYERQLKTQGTLKNGRITSVGMPGVSSAKLPPTVPKVNSKWDGTPLTAKEMEKKERLAAHEKPKFFSRSSASDQSLSSSNGSLRTSTRRPTSKGTLSAASVYTTHSDGNRNQLADLYGWEIQDFGGSDGASSRPSTKGISVKSMPTFTSQGAAVESSEPPKIPSAYIDPHAPPKPLSPHPPAHSHSPSLTPCSESPATPIGVSPMLTVSAPDSEKTLHDSPTTHENIRTTTIEAPAALDTVIINSSGVNILPPPLTARRKPKPAPSTDSLAPPRTGTSRPTTPTSNLNKEPKSILKKDSVPSLTHSSNRQSMMDPPKTATNDWTRQAAHVKAKMSFSLPLRSKSLEDLLGNGRSGDRSHMQEQKGEDSVSVGRQSKVDKAWPCDDTTMKEANVEKTGEGTEGITATQSGEIHMMRTNIKRIDSPTLDSSTLLERRKSRAAIFKRDQERWRERQIRTDGAPTPI